MENDRAAFANLDSGRAALRRASVRVFVNHTRGWLAGAAVLGFAAAGFAQLGDARGERQVSQVPAHRIPPSPALSPAEALKSFKLAPGFRLEIAACEPLVQDPVAISFGPDGRLWVVEMRGFMPDLDGRGEDQPVGRVVVLSDRDRDGRYDDSIVFVDQLVLPRAVLPVGDGALVGAPPELAFWRDANGDGRADTKVVLATDYGVKVDPQRPYFANPELAPNGLLWAFDNWIYSAAYTRKFRLVKGEWESAPTAFRGQWGLTQDDFGRLFHNSNADQLRIDVIFAEYLQRNPNYPQLAGANVNAAADQRVWPVRVTPGVNRGYQPEVLLDGRLKQFTAACAPWVYRGDLLPEYYGNVFVAEPAANLVRRNVLTASEGSVVARNAYEQREFIASTDERFRPVNFATGPDGALYIVDLYRGVLQHRLSLTTYLRRQSLERGLVQPQHLGRIYRVVPAGTSPPRMTQIAALTNEEWVARLSHPNAWWRETAQRLLVERCDVAVIPALRTMAKGPHASGRIHALWTLQGMHALDVTTVLTALQDPEPNVRTAALRLSEAFLASPRRAQIIERLLACTTDPSPFVQLQAVLTLGARDASVDLALAGIVRAHPENRFLPGALYSGLADRELVLLERLLADSQWPAVDPAGNAVLAGLAAGVYTSRNVAGVERVFALAAAKALNAAKSGGQARALIDGLAAAAAQERRPLRLAQRPDGWSTLEKVSAMTESLRTLNDALVWAGKPGVETAAAPLTVEQRTRFAAGREIFAGVCAACHQPSGRGLEGLAPPLLDSEWVLGRPERLIRVVLHGLSGPIKVRRRQYTGDMPGLGQVLKDEQIAAVLTYIRREWGHTAAPVEPEDVAAQRAATAAHSGPWSGEELRWAK